MVDIMKSNLCMNADSEAAWGERTSKGHLRRWNLKFQPIILIFVKKASQSLYLRLKLDKLLSKSSGAAKFSAKVMCW